MLITVVPFDISLDDKSSIEIFKNSKTIVIKEPEFDESSKSIEKRIVDTSVIAPFGIHPCIGHPDDKHRRLIADAEIWKDANGKKKLKVCDYGNRRDW